MVHLKTPCFQNQLITNIRSMKSDLKAQNNAVQFNQATEYPQPYSTEHVLIMIPITLKGFYIQ